MMETTAAGLYYIAELVEEYTVIAKKVMTIIILFVTTIYLMLLVADDLPWSLVICGLASQASYFLILKDFPFFTLSSPTFIGASVLLVVNHYLALTHFAQNYQDVSQVNMRTRLLYLLLFHTFTTNTFQVLGFFTICLWMIPLGFIVSLNANDNILPTHGHTEKSSLTGTFSKCQYYR